jgi:hypothetical protein
MHRSRHRVMLPASSLASVNGRALRALPRRQTHVRPRDVAQRATWREWCTVSRRPAALASTAAHSLRLGRNAVEPDFPNGCDEEFCLRCLRISVREHVVDWENRKNDLANCSRAQETTETKPLFMGSTDEAHPWRAVSPLSPSVSARAGKWRLSEEDCRLRNSRPTARMGKHTQKQPWMQRSTCSRSRVYPRCGDEACAASGG